MLKTEALLAYAAIVESGSIIAAARRLRLSKSVVSERLAELEKSLGVVLLHRTTRKLTLTEDGTAFLERARRILAEIEDAVADISERRGTLAGPLRLAAPVTFGRLHLGPALCPFLRQNPELALTLDIDDRRVDAVADGFDAVIRHGPIADSRLIAWKLAPSRRLLLASPDYLERFGTPRSLKELETHRGIFYTNRGVSDWRFETEDGPILVRARPAAVVNNGDMLRDAAIAGLGLAMLPTFIAGAAVREGLLQEVVLEHKPAQEFIYMAYPQGRGASAKLRAIAEHLRVTFGDPPYWES
ncbi:LysR family transcriptional regulator [Rhizobium deserti]|uniref:HTH-type transcriptional regulator TtuA n=1 Tax=Rhizobium deserti TaxID=2547961 RepID=A0A4R5UNP9_9HYPH|nr:LysR family transcriptional regulator [Rhizobium deserti]TDK39552.1 LysR family transcriptional regulator [Rhizobium deserti]